MVDTLHFVGAGTIYSSVTIFLGTNQLYKTAQYKSTIKLRDMYIVWFEGTITSIKLFNKIDGLNNHIHFLFKTQ